MRRKDVGFAENSGKPRTFAGQLEESAKPPGTWQFERKQLRTRWMLIHNAVI
jgi:hypothetical protein